MYGRRSSRGSQDDVEDEGLAADRVKEVTQCVLSAHFKKGGLKEDEVKKVVKDAVHVAGKQMREVLGCQLRKDGDRLFINYEKDIPSADEGSGDVLNEAKQGLITTVLMFIHMTKNPLVESEKVKEEELWEFLEMLGVFQKKTHPVFGYPPKLIAPSNSAEFVEQGWLSFEKKREWGVMDSTTYDWGPRAYAVIDPQELLADFCEIMEDKPKEWKEHFKLKKQKNTSDK